MSKSKVKKISHKSEAQIESGIGDIFYSLWFLFSPSLYIWFQRVQVSISTNAL